MKKRRKQNKKREVEKRLQEIGFRARLLDTVVRWWCTCECVWRWWSVWCWAGEKRITGVVRRWKKENKCGIVLSGVGGVGGLVTGRGDDWEKQKWAGVRWRIVAAQTRNGWGSEAGISKVSAMVDGGGGLVVVWCAVGGWTGESVAGCLGKWAGVVGLAAIVFGRRWG